MWPIVAGVGVAVAAYGIRLALRLAQDGDVQSIFHGGSVAEGEDKDTDKDRARAPSAAPASNPVSNPPPLTSSVLGLYVGDTAVRAAILEGAEEAPRVVETTDGLRAFPTTLVVARDGELLTGSAALRRRHEPGAVASSFATSLLGATKDSELATAIAARAPEEARPVATVDGGIALDFEGDVREPHEVVALVMGQVRDAAARVTGRPAWRATAAVPATVGEEYVAALRRAAQTVGILQLAVVHAPVAAVMAARRTVPLSPGPVLVYHLGARRATATVVDVDAAASEPPSVLSATETMFVGGENFDAAVVDWLVRDFRRTDGVDLRADALATSRLQEAAQKARHELSSAPTTTIHLPFITADKSGPKHLRAELTRADYEAIVDELTAAAVDDTCTAALEGAGVQGGGLADLIIFGALGRAPHVRARVERACGLTARVAGPPEDLCAIGAAVVALEAKRSFA